jgi:hypothetical protein
MGLQYHVIVSVCVSLPHNSQPLNLLTNLMKFDTNFMLLETTPHDDTNDVNDTMMI